MQFLLVLGILFTAFMQKWYLTRGTGGPSGRLIIGDTDGDGNYEFIFTPYETVFGLYFYELHLPNTWEVDSFPYLYSALVWDIGDYDLDGFWDLAIQSSVTQSFPTMVISIAESPDSFSYPTQEVWRDTVGFPLVTPICTYDIDQDGLPEMVKVIGDTTDFDIYESIGNNLYSKIYRDTIPEGSSPMSTLAFGDFDLDGQNEFVFGYSGGEYSIWECVGDNLYQEIIDYQQLPTANIKDCFSVPDADGDGKMEFVVKGFTPLDARTHCFIFEATGDNTYEIIKSFDLSGGSNSYYGGYSEAGDVDGDGIPEIVLESASYVYLIKARDNDLFYLWDTLPGNASGSNVRVTNDIDQNGLNEIVISGNNETRIYEYVGPGIEETAQRTTPYALRLLQVYPNPFTIKTTIRFTIQDSRFMIKEFSLKIYDAAGRLVKSFNLESCIMNHVSIISWEGNDNSGRKLPAGIYFVRLEADAYKKVEKAILLR